MVLSKYSSPPDGRSDQDRIKQMEEAEMTHGTGLRGTTKRLRLDREERACTKETERHGDTTGLDRKMQIEGERHSDAEQIRCYKMSEGARTHHRPRSRWYSIRRICWRSCTSLLIEFKRSVRRSGSVGRRRQNAGLGADKSATYW